MPGNEPPARSRLSDALADVITTRWNSGGYCSDRCGSLATIETPAADLAAATTQLFEPTLASAGLNHSFSASARVARARSGSRHFAIDAGSVLRTWRTSAACVPVGDSVCARSLGGAADRIHALS